MLIVQINRYVQKHVQVIYVMHTCEMFFYALVCMHWACFGSITLAFLLDCAPAMYMCCKLVPSHLCVSLKSNGAAKLAPFFLDCFEPLCGKESSLLDLCCVNKNSAMLIFCIVPSAKQTRIYLMTCTWVPWIKCDTPPWQGYWKFPCHLVVQPTMQIWVTYQTTCATSIRDSPTGTLEKKMLTFQPSFLEILLPFYHHKHWLRSTLIQL